MADSREEKSTFVGAAEEDLIRQFLEDVCVDRARETKRETDMEDIVCLYVCVTGKERCACFSWKING